MKVFFRSLFLNRRQKQSFHMCKNKLRASTLWIKQDMKSFYMIISCTAHALFLFSIVYPKCHSREIVCSSAVCHCFFCSDFLLFMLCICADTVRLSGLTANAYCYMPTVTTYSYAVTLIWTTVITIPAHLFLGK